MLFVKNLIKEKVTYISLLVGILLLHLASLHPYFNVEIACSDSKGGLIQLFYDDGVTGFLESKSVIAGVNPENIIHVGVDGKELHRLRIDFDGVEKMSIRTIKIKHGETTFIEINPGNYNEYIQQEHDCVIVNEQKELKFNSNGNDSYLVLDIGCIEGEKVFFIIRLVFRILKFICIIVLLFFVYKLGTESKLCSENTRFVILASLFGIIYSFTIIPWQIPDEWTHLKMIGEGFNNASLVEILKNDMPLSEEVIRSNNRVNISSYELISAMTKRPSYTLIDCIPRGISYEFIRHFPSAIGIMVGILLRLPTYWVLQFGELFSLAFYIIVCNYALRLTPIKKSLFEVVMLMPMCIQQMASINYDSVLLPLSFFFVAYILCLKYEKDKIIVGDFIILCVTLVVMAVIKLPYGVMGLMLLLLPWDKIEFSGRLKKLSKMNKSLRRYGGGVYLAYQC